MKKGDWKELVVSTKETIADITGLLALTYMFEDYVLDRLEVYFIIKIGMNGNTKKVISDRYDLIKTSRCALRITKVCRHGCC